MNLKPDPTQPIPPAEIAEKIAKRNGNTDVTKKLPKLTVKPPPAALPPKKK